MLCVSFLFSVPWYGWLLAGGISALIAVFNFLKPVDGMGVVVDAFNGGAAQRCRSEGETRLQHGLRMGQGAITSGAGSAWRKGKAKFLRVAIPSLLAAVFIGLTFISFFAA